MTDTQTTADRIVADAEAGLEVLDAQIAQMRSQRIGLNAGIAKALADRKPLARIVSAAAGRRPKSDD